MTKHETASVVIGRFQPFHNGHVALLTHALEASEKVVVVLASSYRARSSKHPFYWAERAEMIEAAMPGIAERLIFIPVRDYFDDHRWAREIGGRVSAVCENAKRVTLLGAGQDDLARYRKLFPQWSCIEAGRHGNIDADMLRRALFAEDAAALLRTAMPAASLDHAQACLDAPTRKKLQREWQALEDEKKAWASAPFPPVFVTADAVVHCNNSVLLIQRDSAIGDEEWALPGGHLDPGETLYNTAVRELTEETHLGVTAEELRAACHGSRIFDHPLRSSRQRVITQAFYFDLGVRDELSRVEKCHETHCVRWVALEEIKNSPYGLFDDHLSIVEAFYPQVGTTDTFEYCFRNKRFTVELR